LSLGFGKGLWAIRFPLLAASVLAVAGDWKHHNPRPGDRRYHQRDRRRASAHEL